VSDYRKLMHVGIVHPMAFPETGKGEGPVVETVATVAKDEFFGVIEVRPAISDAVRKEVAEVIKQSGILPIISGQPPLLGAKLNLNASDEGAREAAVECVKRSIDEAVAYGAPDVAVLRGPDPGPEAREREVGQLVKSLSECCAYAREVSTGATPIHISLEQFDHDVDKKCLAGPIGLCVEVIEKTKAAGNANVGLLVALSHLPILNETARNNLTQAAPHLIHVHAGNAFVGDPGDPANGDQHPRFGYPGSLNDVGELTEFLRVLQEVGYFAKKLPTGKPVVTFDVKPVPSESAELGIAGAKRAFLEAGSAL